MYKTFISHSNMDSHLVNYLHQSLILYGIEPYLAERDLKPNHYLSEKVIHNLKNSDCVVVLLTRNGVCSKYVQNEVGIAIGSNIPIVPIVEKGIRSEELAVLQGKEYIEYDPYFPENGLFNTVYYINSLKLRKEQNGRTLFALGIGAAILYASSN